MARSLEPLGDEPQHLDLAPGEPARARRAAPGGGGLQRVERGPGPRRPRRPRRSPRSGAARPRAHAARSPRDRGAAAPPRAPAARGRSRTAHRSPRRARPRPPAAPARPRSRPPPPARGRRTGSRRPAAGGVATVGGDRAELLDVRLRRRHVALQHREPHGELDGRRAQRRRLRGQAAQDRLEALARRRGVAGVEGELDQPAPRQRVPLGLAVQRARLLGRPWRRRSWARRTSASPRQNGRVAVRLSSAASSSRSASAQRPCHTSTDPYDARQVPLTKPMCVRRLKLSTSRHHCAARS